MTLSFIAPAKDFLSSLSQLAASAPPPMVNKFGNNQQGAQTLEQLGERLAGPIEGGRHTCRNSKDRLAAFRSRSTFRLLADYCAWNALELLVAVYWAYIIARGVSASFRHMSPTQWKVTWTCNSRSEKKDGESDATFKKRLQKAQEKTKGILSKRSATLSIESAAC